MNERSRYEDELARQLEDLPIPDENTAWADMKRRLEEDDDDAVIIPPFTWGCGGWVLLLIILLALGWWIIRPEKLLTAKEEKIEKQQDIAKPDLSQPKTTSWKNINDSNAVHINPPTDKTTVDITDTGSKELKEEGKKTVNSNSPSSSIDEPAFSPSFNNETPGKKQVASKRGTVTTPGQNKKSNPAKKIRSTKTEDLLVAKNNTNKSAPGESPTEKKEVFPDTSQQKITRDQLVKKTKDSLTKIEEAKKQKPAPKKYSFGTGLSLFQQIPVAGQSAVPYNSQGRKFSMADYIPTVYARLYRENTWFIQAGFRYGAPQFTKQFTYGQKIDTAGNITTTTSNNLKKTFYHQLPVSFNYYILPNLSVGTGVVWNKFYSAVYEQDITERNNITQVESTVSKGIKQTKSDTSLVKSYFQALFETQYKWRKFSIGARYSFGLEPYVTFTLPGLAPQEEKNSALQIFLRYELWRSKKKDQ